uniref:Zinc transporter foi n=1 Tax=Anopheles maculatus TaxID=74869 RepID=A0A182S8G6_9DIPT
MAVCVVCLLCADHVPCKQHFSDSHGSSKSSETAGRSDTIRDVRSLIDLPYEPTIVAQSFEAISPGEDWRNSDVHRIVKRHHHHHHNHHDTDDDHDDEHDTDGTQTEFDRLMKDKMNQAMRKIFTEYGNPASMTMDVQGFERMVRQLGMFRLIPGATATGESDGNVLDGSGGDGSEASVSPVQIDSLKERSGCFGEDSVPPLQVSSLLEQNDPHHHHHHHHHDGGSSEAAVWIYSSIAILGVSLCGLLGVVVIPCMEKHFYHHVLQFLVALAIGTLCGDALLHLLPHAMLSSLENSKAAHDSMMYKGLAAVLGIVFFYFMERFLTVIAEWCKTRQKKDKPPSRVRVMRDPESTSLHASSAGEKQCKHKYSSYPYCYDEIAMDTKDDHHEHNNTGTNENHNSALAKCANHHHNGELSADHTAEYTALNNHQQQQPNHTQSNHQSLREETNDNNTVSTNLDEAGSIESSEQANNHHHLHHHSGGRQGSKSSEQTSSGKLRPENYTIILREHETKHHGHSHTHGHVHSPPGSLSAVAWMVVMGDGLHNFTDGMTIGAAFANNIAGGFSTAIAVFCHELPHELGDFAVLLKAGMSAREAVYYNLLSSLLSLLGMVLGIVVGHQPEASGWVFAVAAGMFLYIAMVDMIPELTSSHGAEERCKTSEFVLQFLGLTLGFSIMMVIAMYEHDLMLLFVE